MGRGEKGTHAAKGPRGWNQTGAAVSYQSDPEELSAATWWFGEGLSSGEKSSSHEALKVGVRV